MADPPETGFDAADDKPAYPPVSPDAPWSQVWQLPVLLLGLGLLALGVWVVMPSHETPSMASLLDDVAMYLEAHNLDKAQEKLTIAKDNQDLATPVQVGRIYALYGDLNYLQLHKSEIAFGNAEKVKEAQLDIVSYYRKAEERNTGYQLATRPLGRLAQTLVALDRNAEALAVIDRLQDAPAEDRYGVIRQMIERKLNQPKAPTYADVAPLFERFRTEVRLEKDVTTQLRQTVWITKINAQLWLDADPKRASDYLNRHIMRLKALGLEKELAPLYVMLARAQSAQEQYEAAEQTFAYAERMLPKSHALQAEVLVGVAHILLSHGPEEVASREGGMREALELYKRAVEQFPSEPTYIEALIGQADVETRLGQHNQAHKHFALAVDALRHRAPEWDPRREMLTHTILSHAQHAVEQNSFERSLQLLTQLRPLFSKRLPPEIVLKFAKTHEMIARQHHDAAVGKGGSLPTPDARRMHNQEAAIHFGRSAEYFWQYAELKTRTDDKAHGNALWQAAQNFDRAQLWENAIKVYQEFVASRIEDHRLLQAKHLLGKARMANSEYSAAIDLFNELRRDHPKGRWTYESLVPLARAYAANDQFAAARRVLLEATENHPAITPDSEIYRGALVELGRLYYEAGREDPGNYVRAVETLTEAVQRFGGTADGPSLRYMLADANRRSVVTLEVKLRDNRAQRELIALQAERLRRLQEAQIYFNQVITELEDRDEQELSPLERTYFRNAYFFQADCAFDRGQFEQAIGLYDEAAKRWKSDPASLVAHVQIVNAYCELGKYDSARRANENALWALERLPDEVFNDPTLPMSRQHWEDWLRWTSEIDLFGAQARAR